MRVFKALRGVSVVAGLALLLMTVGAVLSPVMFAADAADPTVTLNSPTSPSSNTTPSFTGTASDTTEVTVTIYAGATANGTVVSTATATGTGAGWSSGKASPALSGGQYTAVATQGSGVSEPVTFRVDTSTVTLNSPTSPSSNTTPSFTGTASATTSVTVKIYAGATAKGTVVSAATATGTGAAWSSGNASPALSSGQYTARANQGSAVSKPVTFTVTPSPTITPVPSLPTSPPVASFKWFPPVPQTGEPVSIVSISTDAASPITSLAWALTGTGPFQAGGPVLNTSFSIAGGHVVRLRVTNANGLSSVATETINVIGPTASLMQPFPVVQIAGTETRSGVRLKLLKVQQVPQGAQITVRCKGRGCPIRSARRVAAASKRGIAPFQFRAFERSLRAGVSLEILVTKRGQIGKYTRFTIRRGRPPERVDMCLTSVGSKPLVCPSS